MLAQNEEGIFTCPYGFSCIKKGDNVYNCLLIKEYYNLRKIKPKKEKNQKVFTLDEINSLIELNEEIESNILECEFEMKNTNDFLHDITKANSLIVTKIDSINKQNLSNKEKSKVESINHLSDFITKRIDLYRYINNPELIKSGRFRERDAYKLWDIYRFIFNELASKNKLQITMQKFDLDEQEISSSKTTFYAKDSVTILPFLLIDNAVKYSKEQSEINIKFYQNNNMLKRIEIVSEPSYKIEDAANQLFERGYRSKNNTSKSSGSGLGLHIVKLICEHNNIDINICVKNVVSQLFSVVMDFKQIDCKNIIPKE